MIHYSLHCTACGHGFDGWFRAAGDFDRQSNAGLIECPACGGHAVEKALMAPSVARSSDDVTSSVALGDSRNEEIMRKLQELSREVRANADYVGAEFAEEARRIHFGEAESRGIYGEASPDEVRSLHDDGIAAVPLLPLPEDRN